MDIPEPYCGFTPPVMVIREDGFAVIARCVSTQTLAVL